MSGISHCGSLPSGWCQTNTQPYCSLTGKTRSAARGWAGRLVRDVGLSPSGPHRQPWNGQSTQSPTTLPPWPMWAPRCSAVRRQHVQLAGLVAVGDEVLAEVPQRTHFARGELGRPADHEPAGDLPGERDLHASRLLGLRSMDSIVGYYSIGFDSHSMSGIGDALAGKTSIEMRIAPTYAKRGVVEFGPAEAAHRAHLLQERRPPINA